MMPKQSCLRVRLSLLLMVSLLLLNSCAHVKSAQDSTPAPEEGTFSAPTDIVPDPSFQPSLLQAFEKALLNEAPFFYTDQDRNPVYQGNMYLREIDEARENIYYPSQFAVADMDGDGVPEVIYQKYDYLGFVILRYREGTIYGYGVNYRGLIGLKKDGSYSGSGGWIDISLGKMRFLGPFRDTDEKAHAIGQGDVDYYVNDEVADETIFNELWEEYESKSDVEWHEYTNDMVLQWLPHDLASFNSSEYPSPTEMQNYLDSLAELLYREDDYGTITNVSSADAQLYYDGWNRAMESIYTLCLDKFSDHDKDALITEQQHWMSLFSQRQEAYSEAEQETQYLWLGDLIKNRVYRLVSLYFDDHFYDICY